MLLPPTAPTCATKKLCCANAKVWEWGGEGWADQGGLVTWDPGWVGTWRWPTFIQRCSKVLELCSLTRRPATLLKAPKACIPHARVVLDCYRSTVSFAVWSPPWCLGAPRGLCAFLEANLHSSALPLLSLEKFPWHGFQVGRYGLCEEDEKRAINHCCSWRSWETHYISGLASNVLGQMLL